MEAGIKFATRMNMPYKVFVDRGISGTKGEEDRPEFADFLNAIKGKEIDSVYCYEQSRLEREPEIWIMLSGAILHYGIAYYPNGQLTDLTDPVVRANSLIYSAMSQMLVGNTSKKVKSALRINASKGKAHGLTAYGLDKDKDGFFKINKEEAKVVRRIYKLSLAGIGAYIIAKTLNEEGIPTKYNRYKGVITRKDSFTKKVHEFKKSEVKWRGNVIHDMLRNPIYKGIRKWNGEEIKIPAIIDAETWEKVNRNLPANKKNVGKRAEYRYLLNGLLVCGHCGAELKGKRRLRGHDNAYKCPTKRSGVGCQDSRGISIPRLESALIKLLFLDENFRKELLKLSAKSKDDNSDETSLNKKKEDLKSLEKRIERVYNLLENTDLKNDTELVKRLNNAKAQKNSTLETIDILERKIADSKYNTTKQLIKQADVALVMNTDFTAIKRLLHGLIDKIVLRHKKQDKGGIFFAEIRWKMNTVKTHVTTTWQAATWRYGSYLGQPTIKNNRFDPDRFITISEDDLIHF